MWSLLRRTLVFGCFAALLAVNVLTLTWSAATATLSSLLGAIGVSTVYSQMEIRQRAQARGMAAQKARMAAQQRKLRRVGDNIRRRTIRSAAANIGSLPAEAVPFLGWAVVIGVTGYELKLACDNLRDLDALYNEMGVATETDDEIMATLCNPDLDSLGEAYARVPLRLRQEYAQYLEETRRAAETPDEAAPPARPPG